MKISYNWLKEFVDVDLAPRELAEKLTMVGLAVDAVESHGPEDRNDHVLEIDLTSNRPDCLSHLGVAREAAAVTGQALKERDGATARRRDVAIEKLAAVEILNPELCPRYTAQVIQGVKIGPSPAWLVERLEAMGQRSVNNVADITNYVMLELGQPLHAFDLDELRGKRIIVRAAKPGERIITLDKEERELTPQMLVIADAERPVALGGIKGGEDSGITNKTVNVLLEAAYFTPAQVRATSRAVGLATEASYRFERGVDPEIAAVASTRAARLIVELAGGEIIGDLMDVYPRKVERKRITFRLSRYTALTGLQIELTEAERILRSLGFDVEPGQENGSLSVLAPTWRIDANIEEDVIEEVARIFGYDKLKNTLPGSAGAGAYLPGEQERRATRRALTAAGYNEAVGFSFVNGETDAELSSAPDESRLLLTNPIDETQAHMRTNLLGGLLRAVERNFNHGLRNIRLFEIGKCFTSTAETLGNAVDALRPHEAEHLALIATGARNEADWQASSTGVDFYDLKGAVESVAASAGLPALSFAASGAGESGERVGHLHPGRAAVISLGGHQVGRLGQLHPRVAANYKFKQPVFVAELDLGAMLRVERGEVRYHPLPKFPAASRDLALLIDRQVPLAAIESAIEKLAITELVNLRLFDLYAGSSLPEGKHSIALSLRYQALDRTLTDEEVSAAHERIVSAVKQEFGAEVR